MFIHFHSCSENSSRTLYSATPCGTLAPQPGVEPTPTVLAVLSLDHQGSAKESPVADADSFGLVLGTRLTYVPSDSARGGDLETQRKEQVL